MFGMGLGEILLIAIIAIIFLGPEKLPQAMIDVAKFFKSFKRSIQEAKSSLEEEIKISELKSEALEYKKKLDAAARELEQVKGLATLDLPDEAKNSPKEIGPSGSKGAKDEVATFEKKSDQVSKTQSSADVFVNIDESKDRVNV